ncbi:hypothetical protein Nepgr_001821 [Nepenthes gracilis]|uniref:Uncharacterized protein n=1 Tax=Nepenthes gracilis TaxID=150966 RepID=A0AAD3P5Y3_NEPGR|nr:hypothetical protein Nepgr_001821 [Nepenthes gracilis]
MEARVSPSNCNSYLSALTNSGKRSSIKGFFFSLPTSPTTGISRTPSGFESEPNGINEEFEFEFEFGESQRFFLGNGGDKNKQNLLQNGEFFPAISYADELFDEGKVLPLKLPPRLQHASSDNKHGNRGSTASSPGSRMPFVHRTLWNDNFDPFTAALEKVKDDEKMLQIKDNQRASWGNNRMGMPLNIAKAPDTGLERLVKGTTASVFVPAVRTQERVDAVESPDMVKAWRWKIKRLFTRNGSLGRPVDGDRSYSSSAIVEMCRALKTLHRPRLFLCMSFGHRSPQNKRHFFH